MGNLKLIIFDLDGTLVNAYPAIIKSFNYTMQKLGYPRQRNKTIIRAVGWGDENLLRPFVKETDLKKALFVYRGHHKKALLKWAHLFPGIKKMLADFRRRKFLLAIASNRPTRFTRILINSLRINKYFDYVLCADRLKKAKPSPEILLEILRRFLVSAKEAIYVGDMNIDVRTAKRARVRSIAVTSGSCSRKELIKERPLMIIKGAGILYSKLGIIDH